jgi:hypothetical protein
LVVLFELVVFHQFHLNPFEAVTVVMVMGFHFVKHGCFGLGHFL